MIFEFFTESSFLIAIIIISQWEAMLPQQKSPQKSVYLTPTAFKHR